MESFEFLVNNVIPIDGGSNAWAIHGNFTTTGHPFLASDPHLENGLPS
jgi:acyl-homoserine lactone acylase PvdQ